MVTIDRNSSRRVGDAALTNSREWRTNNYELSKFKDLVSNSVQGYGDRREKFTMASGVTVGPRVV